MSNENYNSQLGSPEGIKAMTRSAAKFASETGATQVVVEDTGAMRDATRETFGLKDDGTELDAED